MLCVILCIYKKNLGHTTHWSITTMHRIKWLCRLAWLQAFHPKFRTSCTLWNIKKVKFSRYRLGMAQRVGRGIALLFHDRGTRRDEWSAASPGCTLPSEKTQYSLYRRLGGPQGRSERAENLVTTGIWSPTVQPVVSRYTDWATRPTCLKTEKWCTGDWFPHHSIASADCGLSYIISVQ